MPQVCRFYQSGNCKFGDNCKFDHPGATRSGNRFSTFGGRNNTPAGSLPYGLSKDVIERDLTGEAPTWILSCYGPGKDAPEQLFGGYPREQSVEEIRLHYEKGVAAGKQQEALQEINALYDNAKQQMQAAVSNLDNAVQFIADAANKRPNRLQVIESTNPPGRTPGEFAVGKRATGTSSTPSNAFGGGGTTSGGFGAASGSAFGQPSSLGQKPNPFGSGTSGSSAFGQPSGGSAFAKPAAPAFGSTSGPGSAFGSSGTTSAFGKPSGGGGAFGQPSGGGSAFGQTGGGSAFGQPSALGQKPSPFGAPSGGQTSGSAFGAASGGQTGGSAFGQPSQLGGSGSAFGQPSALGQKPSPFGAPSTGTGTGTGSGFSAFAGGSGGSAFGQAAKPATSSPFGSASQPATSSPFGQPSQPATSSPFGASSQPATTGTFGSGAGQPVANNPFAAPQSQGGSTASNPFAKKDMGMDTGMDAQPTSAFGAQSGSTPFGQPQQQQQQQQQGGANPFGQPNPSAFGATAPAGNAANPYPPDSDKKHPSLDSYAAVSMGRLSSWKGRPVSYKADVAGYMGPSGKWSRIWFPNGPPGYYAETEEKGAEDEARKIWDGFEGRFDVMPELPPLRVHCRWDI